MNCIVKVVHTAGDKIKFSLSVILKKCYAETYTNCDKRVQTPV